MSRIGLVDVDGHNFPNFALMRISAFHKNLGDQVEWADPMFGGDYDKVYMSKIFTFSPDYPYEFDCEVVKGGTGYDVKSRLPFEIESSPAMDYSIYPDCNYSLQFFSRGCIRKCPFCLVRDKEGYIHSVDPVDLNPNGEWIEVLDNNFFANPNWKDAVDYLIKANQPVKLHGVDIRIMTEEQAYWLNKMKLKGNTHIAWDLPTLDLTDKLREVTKYIKPHKLTCYVLIGYNSTIEQDLFRIKTLWDFGIHPFVQPYNPQMEDLNGREPNHPQGHGNHNEKNQCYGNVKRINPTYTDKKHPRSIIKIKAIHCSEDQSHPTQKPIALLEWLIKTYTNRGGLVLDNTMGSGSTGVACVNTERAFIGIELNEEYFRIAEKRINAAIADKQSRLF